MFGLFKRKPARQDGIVRLIEIFEALSNHADDLYSDVERYNPVEVRFFTMSAISVYIQAQGNLPEAEIQDVVGKFIEQATASLIFKMPHASYDLVHNAFIDRFPIYADLIVDLDNPADGKGMQDAIYNLMMTLDANARVERDAVNAVMQGMKIVLPLTHAAGDVRDALR